MGGLSLPPPSPAGHGIAVTPNQIARARVHGVYEYTVLVPAAAKPVAARGRAGRAGWAVDAAGRTELLTASLAQALQLPRANHRNHRASAHPATRMWPLLLLMAVAACGSSLAAARSGAYMSQWPHRRKATFSMWVGVAWKSRTSQLLCRIRSQGQLLSSTRQGLRFRSPTATQPMTTSRVLRRATRETACSFSIKAQIRGMSDTTAFKWVAALSKATPPLGYPIRWIRPFILPLIIHSSRV